MPRLKYNPDHRYLKVVDNQTGEERCKYCGRSPDEPPHGKGAALRLPGNVVEATDVDDKGDPVKSTRKNR